MPSIHLFNPENDIALAMRCANFTPPKGAVAISRAGAPLPLWWCKKGDAVLVPDRQTAMQAETIKQEYGLDGNVTTLAEADLTPDPWGWSLYTRRRMIMAGTDPALCPSDFRLESLRQLSHRRTTIAVHRMIGSPETLIPVEADTVDDALRAIERRTDAVVKLPWSSSGRGVIYSSSMSYQRLRQQIEGMIRHQGSVMIEPHYDRLRDFAALFRTSGGHAEFRGMSIFSTDSNGFYTGNIVAPQEYLYGRIDAPVLPVIDRLLTAIETIIAPHYDGWLGVDMLIYRNSHGQEQIAPCIEINLRRTMGVAALHVNRRLGNSTPLSLTLSPVQGIRLNGI